MDFFEACEKYSKFPRLIILKIELQRRGFILSQSALDNVNILIHQTKERSFSREIQGHYPVSFMLRDGTSVVTRPILKTKIGVDPFLIDFNQERFVISFHKISMIISDICVKKIGSSSQTAIWYIVKAPYYSLFSSRQSVVVTAKKPSRACTLSIPLYFSAIPLMILRP